MGKTLNFRLNVRKEKGDYKEETRLDQLVLPMSRSVFVYSWNILVPESKGSRQKLAPTWDPVGPSLQFFSKQCCFGCGSKPKLPVFRERQSTTLWWIFWRLTLGVSPLGTVGVTKWPTGDFFDVPSPGLKPIRTLGFSATSLTRMRKGLEGLDEKNKNVPQLGLDFFCIRNYQKA